MMNPLMLNQQKNNRPSAKRNWTKDGCGFDGVNTAPDRLNILHPIIV
jgi:hypothetical protein